LTLLRIQKLISSKTLYRSASVWSEFTINIVASQIITGNKCLLNLYVLFGSKQGFGEGVAREFGAI
jgi:hypothetical protein